MSNTYLQRTFGSGNQQLWTWSGWVKRSKLGTDQQIFGRQIDGGNIGAIRFQSDDAIRVNNQISGTGVELYTTMKFRDTNGWYHLVVVFKGAESTASDRVDIYVNGEEIDFTVISSSTAGNGSINGSGDHFIGKRAPADNDRFLEAVLSHVHFIDGTAYDATAFGEYDANGVWKINTSPSVTYGTNGFFILKDGNSVTDQSGEGNNFTVGGGTLTNTEDSPSNVFATLNPLDVFNNSGRTLSNGNLDYTTSSGNNSNISGTIAVSGSGKWYFETKISAQSGASSSSARFGIVGVRDLDKSTPYVAGNAYYIYSDGRKEDGANTTNSAHPGYSLNDIVQVALDLDNGNIYFGLNGNWGDNAGNFNQTFANATAFFTSINTDGFWTIWLSKNVTADNTLTLSANFGNGYFGTTAVSSAGTNASGIGIFEYDVPTGYTALSTKGLNL